MNAGTLLILLLLLACPLGMLFMHRGDHGGHASHGVNLDHMHGGVDETSGTASLDELRRQRDALEADIAELERSESETKTPAAV